MLENSRVNGRRGQKQCKKKKRQNHCRKLS